MQILKEPKGSKKYFERLSDKAAQFAGTTIAFGGAALVVLIWALTGPFMHFSDKWELTINSITTIVTFLMVFLIQRSQNKDVQALQIKLDELLKNQSGANKDLIRIDEEASESELKNMRDQYRESA